MKLIEQTWENIADLDKGVVIVIPTGSVEQHGKHLPLGTDTLLATAVCERIESELPNQILLSPCFWLGASMHHMKFAGSATAEFETYLASLTDFVNSMISHGITKFLLINGHGGNTSPNDILCRKVKNKNLNIQIGHTGYFNYIPDTVLEQTLSGPLKGIRHACEAETSLMMHLHPHLVRKENLKDDGLKQVPDQPSVVWHFDEVTEDGSWGYATEATAEKGKILFDSACTGLKVALQNFYQGLALQSDMNS